MEATSLAEWSNLMVYAAMGTLVIAMLVFAVSFSRSRAAAAPSRILVGAGAPVPVDALPSEVPASEVPALDPGRRAGNVGLALTWLGLGLLLAGLVLRGMWADRVPWANMYEFSLSSAAGILAVYLGISIRRDVRWLGVAVTGAAVLTLGLAVTVLYTEGAQLVPALNSYWLIIHVSAAVICGGAFAVAAGTAAAYLVQARAESRGRTVGRLPAAARLEVLTYRILAFAFPLWTFAVVAGAIWAENAWGRYWGWDPKETWAFITWVIYAAYLHARATAGWRGTRAAWISLVGFLAFLINYFGVNMFVNSLHSYSGL
jgi:cytochrome c-type biogenesis protein CcsB